MKLFFIVSLLSLVLVGCSHHHNDANHHHHQFNKMCAYEVGQNHFNIKANDEIFLNYEGETYYFSSEEKKKLFQEEVEKNVKKSKENWLNSQGTKK